MVIEKEFLGQRLVISDDSKLLKECYEQSAPFIAVLNDCNKNDDLSFARYAVTEDALELGDDMDGFYEKVVRRFINEPVIVACSDRIFLRELRMSDLEQLTKIYGESQGLIEPFYNNDEEAETILKEYIPDYYDLHGVGMYGIVPLRNIGIAPEYMPIVGIAGLGFENGAPELGYAVLEEYRGRGYGLEAADMVLSFYYDVVNPIDEDRENHNQDNEVIVRVSDENKASLHLVNKLKDKYNIKLLT